MGITLVYFSAANVAAQLGVDRSTVTRWVESGYIRPAVQLVGERGAHGFSAEEIERVRALRSSAVAAS